MAGLGSWLAKQIAKPLAYAAERFNLPFLNRFASLHGNDLEHMAEELARAERSMIKYPASGAHAPRVESKISPPEIGPRASSSSAPAAATTKALSITSNAEAYAAAQQIKTLAKTVHNDPKQVAELARQTLAIFGSKTAGGPYVAEVTKALSHSMKDAKSPTVQHSLQRLTDTGRSLIEERMKHRSDSILHLGSALERDARMHESRSLISANIGDARALMESGATGSQRHFALGTILKSVSNIAGEQGQNAATALLARTAQTPALLKELTEFATRNKEGAHLFTPDTLATIAKANSAAFSKDGTWHSTLTHALDTQFGNNAKEQLNWITANATGLPGAALGNEMVERALRFSSHMPIDPARPIHTIVVNVAKNVHLSPQTEDKLTKFWLETNANLRRDGHSQQANQSALHAIANTPHGSSLASRAEAELRIGQHTTPVPPTQSFEQTAAAPKPATGPEAVDPTATVTRPSFHRELDSDPIIVPPATGGAGTIPSFHFSDSRTPGTPPRMPLQAQNDPRIVTTDNMHDVGRTFGRPVTHLRAE